ncbi:MAG: ABC transporter substrate-binding protein [Pseudomonadota bacterium]|nr:ABC transporter substrate-binding protein [Pseudomonadota bacterium]
MKAIKPIAMALALLSTAIPALHPARAEESAATGQAQQVHEAFAKDFAQKVLAIVQDPKKDMSDRKDVLRQAFSKSVDIDWIARFVLGKAWNEATDEQRQQYTSLYRTYLTESYVSNFAEDPDKRIRDIRIAGVGDAEGSDFTVRTQMMLANQDNLNVKYLVRENAGKYKVLDIIIENVSLITTHRAEFGSIAASQGVRGVIAKLEALVSRAHSMAMSMK